MHQCAYVFCKHLDHRWIIDHLIVHEHLWYLCMFSINMLMAMAMAMTVIDPCDDPRKDSHHLMTRGLHFKLEIVYGGISSKCSSTSLSLSCSKMMGFLVCQRFCCHLDLQCIFNFPPCTNPKNIVPFPPLSQWWPPISAPVTPVSAGNSGKFTLFQKRICQSFGGRIPYGCNDFDVVRRLSEKFAWRKNLSKDHTSPEE